jgi:hypothetical protein
MARNGFDISRTLRGVANRKPELGHRFVEAPVEVYKCVGRPEFLAQFVPRYYFAWALQQKG